MADKDFEEIAQQCIAAARAHKAKREQAEQKLAKALVELVRLKEELETADALFRDLIDSSQSLDRENDELRARNQQLREENEQLMAKLDEVEASASTPHPAPERTFTPEMFQDYANALNASRILQDDNMALVRRAQQAEERVKTLVEENGRLNTTIAKNQQRIRALEKSISDLTSGQAFRFDLGGGLGQPRRSMPQPEFSAEEVTALIKLTHPDRWAGNPELMAQANQLTAKLLKMRKS